MSQECEKYRVAVNSLNIREAPTTASAILGRLVKSDVVEKLAESEDSQWIRINVNGVDGWSSRKFMSKVPYIPGPDEDFSWMAVAEQEIGVGETPGYESNPRVVEYLHATTNLSELNMSNDAVSWCSAFVNWCLKQTGYERTKNALARSWLDWGEKIDTPRRGCIVIFSRDEGLGHVAFYLDETETEIRVLGGNQLNPETNNYEVCIKSYPKSKLLGYRIPK